MVKKENNCSFAANDKYGSIMLRSYNNADIYLEKRREHLVRSQVKKYPPA
jgi:hypothetical protein